MLRHGPQVLRQNSKRTTLPRESLSWRNWSFESLPAIAGAALSPRKVMSVPSIFMQPAAKTPRNRKAVRRETFRMSRLFEINEYELSILNISLGWAPVTPDYGSPLSSPRRRAIFHFRIGLLQQHQRSDHGIRQENPCGHRRPRLRRRVHPDLSGPPRRRDVRHLP